MKKISLILISLFLFIVINNLSPLRWFYGKYDCQFSNGDGSFTFAEVNFKGAGFQLCQEIFVEFKKRKLGDTVLYRLCPMNLLHFWDYGQYLFSEKYRVPYKSWQEIEAKRKPVVNKSGFQDF
jgi:hypothetical protein